MKEGPAVLGCLKKGCWLVCQVEATVFDLAGEMYSKPDGSPDPKNRSEEHLWFEKVYSDGSKAVAFSMEDDGSR